MRHFGLECNRLHDKIDAADHADHETCASLTSWQVRWHRIEPDGRHMRKNARTLLVKQTALVADGSKVHKAAVTVAHDFRKSMKNKSVLIQHQINNAAAKIVEENRKEIVPQRKLQRRTTVECVPFHC